MSRQQLKEDELEEQIVLTEEEQQALSKLTEVSDIRRMGQIISILVKSFNGEDVSGEDKIIMLTNPREILERSNYPTYTQAGLAVYLYNIWKITGIQAFKIWADYQSRALISYKGKSREQYVEMTKAAQIVPSQMFALNSPQQPNTIQQPQKAHFWNRMPKPEEDNEKVR